MKRICFAVAIGLVAGLVEAESIKGMSKAQIAERDKQAWGSGELSPTVIAGGQDDVAADLVQIKTALGRELIMMNALVQKTRRDMGGSNGPDYWYQEAFRSLTRPLLNLHKRDFGNIHQLTPAEQKGIKSYQRALSAIDHISTGIRATVREDIDCAIRTGIFHKYLVFSSAKKYYNDNDKMVAALEQVDFHYGELMGDFAAMAEGKGKFTPTADELALPGDRERWLAKMMAARKIAFLDEKGRIYSRLHNNLSILDRYLSKTSDKELSEFSKALEAFTAAHTKVNVGLKAMQEWYNDNALSIDPYSREYIARLVMSYANFIKEEGAFIDECAELIRLFKDNAGNIGKLRQCKGFSPNKAFFLKLGDPSNGTPNYMERVTAIGKEILKEFDKAALKIHMRANGKAKPLVL